jgi:hypothetical protein
LNGTTSRAISCEWSNHRNQQHDTRLAAEYYEKFKQELAGRDTEMAISRTYPVLPRKHPSALIDRTGPKTNTPFAASTGSPVRHLLTTKVDVPVMERRATAENPIKRKAGP